tara:strand:+ start:951 stop:1130 length:180 start_codon:yes stop_codon:yes gene_type:complete
MKSIDECEAIRNLNPCIDKLGKDRDFQQNTANSINWLTNKIIDIEQKIVILESLLRRKK